MPNRGVIPTGAYPDFRPHCTRQSRVFFSEKEKARWLAGPLLIGLQELDFGVFDDAFPYGLVLLFFAYGLGQCYRQDVFYAAGVVDAHVLDLIGG
jgi:hypothetical protein